MSTLVLGSYSFSLPPDVNGDIVLTSTNPVMAGTTSMTIPVGTTAQRSSSPIIGMLRFNSILSKSEEYTGAIWQPAGGTVLQVVSGLVPASSGTGTFTYGNTAQTTANGNLMWTQSFTPLSSTSRIIINFATTISNSNTSIRAFMAIFAGSTNIGAVLKTLPSTASYPTDMSINLVYSPGSTATISFTGRIGSTSGTTYYGQTLGATSGGATALEYTIIEVQ